VVVAGGGGDNAASGVGVGVVRAGEAFVSLGTSGVLFAANDGYQPDPATAVHTFCHALPNTWHQMGVILAATDALNWYAGWSGDRCGALTGELGPAAGPGKTLFLPYLGGERTPLNSAASAAPSWGWSMRPTAGRHPRRAGGRDLRHPRQPRCAGRHRHGWSASRRRRRIAVGLLAAGHRHALDCPVQLPVAGDFGGAFGAARLGLMAATGAGAEIATLPPIARTIDPDPALTDAFDAGHARSAPPNPPSRT
jgi:xylulokinase